MWFLRGQTIPCSVSFCWRYKKVCLHTKENCSLGILNLGSWLWCTALYLSKFQLYACNSEKGVIKNLLLNCIQKSEWRVRFRVDPSFSSTPFVTGYSGQWSLGIVAPKKYTLVMTGNGQNQKSVGMLDAAFRSTAWNAIIRVTWTHFMEWNTYSSEEVRPFRVQVPFARMDKLPTQEQIWGSKVSK